MNSNTDTNDTKAKFTAALVDNETKNAIIELRNETKLSEKQLLRVIVEVANTQREQLLQTAQQIKAQNEAERTERKKAAYESLKQKLAEARKVKSKKAPKASKKDAEIQNAAWKGNLANREVPG